MCREVEAGAANTIVQSTRLRAPCCDLRKRVTQTRELDMSRTSQARTVDMKLELVVISLLIALALWVSPGYAQDNMEHVKPVFERALPNVEGKRMVAVVVTYPPGGKSPAHHHAPSAFIYAHVLSGAIRSQVGDEPVKVFRVGEGFYEVPGSHHRVSENASNSESASLLAIFIVDSQDRPVTIPDK